MNDAGGFIQYIEPIWRFLSMPNEPSPSDFGVLCGSRDLIIADYAASLFKMNIIAKIICSGGIAHVGDKLDTGWTDAEATVFSRRLISLGVPAECILQETRSTNTSENILFSKEIAQATSGALESRMLFIHKPFMCLRTHLTASAILKNKNFSVCAPSVSFLDYSEDVQDVGRLINILVGDFERIFLYAIKGFIDSVDIPATAINACKELRAAGFIGHSLIQN